MLCPKSNVALSVRCYVLRQMLHHQSNMSSVKCSIVSQTLCPQSNVASSVKHYVLKLHILSQTRCILYTGIIWHDYTFNWLSKWMWNSWMFKHAPHPPISCTPPHPPPHTQTATRQRRNWQDQMWRLTKLHTAVFRYTGKYLAALQTSPLKWCRSPVRI